MKFPFVTRRRYEREKFLRIHAEGEVDYLLNLYRTALQRETVHMEELIVVKAERDKWRAEYERNVG